MTAEPTPQQPPPIGGAERERDIDDRLGEALRRIRFGEVRPLWADTTDKQREGWRNIARIVRLKAFKGRRDQG